LNFIELFDIIRLEIKVWKIQEWTWSRQIWKVES